MFDDQFGDAINNTLSYILMLGWICNMKVKMHTPRAARRKVVMISLIGTRETIQTNHDIHDITIPYHYVIMHEMHQHPYMQSWS
jgi:hypothetical protein